MAAGNLKIQVLESADAVAAAASKVIVEAIKAKPRFVLGLATGSTPEKTYAKMAEANKAKQVSFAKVTTFNLDEYWGLDGDHDQSYRYFMNDRLFNHIDIRPWNTNVLNGMATSPLIECAAYEQKIFACGGVDLWLLGIGNNGHVAFNEPGSAVDSRTRLVSLTQSTINANSDGRFFSDPKDVPRCALSAGIGTIREARKIILLATGAGKADAVKAAVEGPFSPDCPASLLQDHLDCTFYLDKAAAAKLS
ncbi:MAG: glucosamine-6-phosphate deaminase [Candidatus Sumerlaeia bacterium]|nr:glucosamine-6-phosphate deaminase [Candidatus Sumerlaeia bacterium]